MSDDDLGAADRNDDHGEMNPLAELLRQLGFTDDDPPDIPTLLGNLNQLVTRLSAQGNVEVQWTAVKDTVRKLVGADGPDPFVNLASNREQAEALRLAASWLDETQVLPEIELTPMLWSRAEWVERTFTGWQTIVAPISERLGQAMMSTFLEQNDDFPDEFVALRNTLAQMMRSAAAMMYAEQVARAIAEVATTVVSSSDAALPLTSNAAAALLPTNIAEFCADLAESERDIAIYLALRETARMRLFCKATWLPSTLLVMVKHYAAEITIDTDVVSSAIDPRELANLDPAELQRVSETLFGKLFRPASTPEQRDVLERIEVLVALIEGWVDAVTETAATKWMTNAEALFEVVRRRRASGGPGEKALRALVGLLLTRRRVQQAKDLWIKLTAQLGAVERDTLWRHPDLLPTAQDLDSPEAFLHNDPAPPDQIDDELRKLLEQGE
ncbi:MAG: zinc-dependent metalloprotease [Propionibacteriaceae bacterium]|nr:zinc-dependent metalloprotease [Propionibacteriaceae bacterium]